MSPPNVLMIPRSRLRPNKRNARTHSRKQISQIANSILRFGWTYPILVDDDYVIIAGHGRDAAAEQLGLQKVPVILMAGLSETEKRALALADNKIAANAGWDRAILAAELGELADMLPECDLSLDFTGFEQAEIDALMGDLVDPEHDPADELPRPPSEPVSLTGDLWHLGPHRLLCGDARKGTDLRALMGAECAAMVFADPPYNLKIASIQGRGRIRHREFAMASGEMAPEAFVRFLADCMALAARYSVAGSLHYYYIDWRHLEEMLAAGRQIYSEWINLVVWAKSTPGQGSLYRAQHELIFLFKNGNAPHVNNIELGRHGRNRSNVWTYAGVNTFRTGRMEDLARHPTSKPVALVADAMRDCSRRGDIVLDPFMGAGTTIVAAERVGRRGYGLEIDPSYVDAAIRRWQGFTRRDAIQQPSGKTFDEVAAARASTPVGRHK